jgi:protease I
VLVSLESGTIQGMEHDEKGDEFDVDLVVSDTTQAEFDGLVLPGGVANPDNLRTHEDAVAFVRGFFAAGKPVGVICHGPWTLIEAGVVDGRRLTSWPSLQTDLRNAGAEWVDEEVVVDGNLVTSRNPDDLPAFNDALLEQLA